MTNKDKLSSFVKSPWFVALLILVICEIVAISFSVLPRFGITNGEIMLLLFESIFTVLITLLSITIPFIWALNQRKSEEDKKTELIHGNTITFLGAELLMNLDTLEKLKDGMNKEYGSTGLNDRDKLIQKMGIVQATAKVLKNNLQDRTYKAILSNGELMNLPPDEINSTLVKAYSDIELCKQRLTEVDAFFDMALNPKPSEINEEIAQEITDNQAEKTIKIVNKDFDTAITSARKCLKKLKDVAETHGWKYEITEPRSPK